MVHDKLRVPQAEVQAANEVIEEVALGEAVDFCREEVFGHIEIEAVEEDEVAAAEEDEHAVEDGDDAVFDVEDFGSAGFYVDEVVDDEVGDEPQDGVVEKAAEIY